jgi:putative transposase
VNRICALYGVTPPGYYAWRRRGESPRRRQDRSLLSLIQAIFAKSRGTYGSPRIHQALRAAGTWISRRRVERPMREAGLRARAARLYRAIPGLHAFFTSIPNRQLNRVATGPDQVWVGDITYLKIGGAPSRVRRGRTRRGAPAGSAPGVRRVQAVGEGRAWQW